MIGRNWAGADPRPVKGEDGASALDAEGRRRVALSIAADCGWPTLEAMRSAVALELGRKA